jgi:S1-C subfamily serine protease
LSFRVQSSTGTDTRTVALTATPMSALAPPTALGLTLRSVPQGSEVVRVARGSAGDLAGIQAGDVITLVGDRQEPAPADVRRAYTLATGDRPLLVAITRDETHHVLAIEKR